MQTGTSIFIATGTRVHTCIHTGTYRYRYIHTRCNTHIPSHPFTSRLHDNNTHAPSTLRFPQSTTQQTRKESHGEERHCSTTLSVPGGYVMIAKSQSAQREHECDVSNKSRLHTIHACCLTSAAGLPGWLLAAVGRVLTLSVLLCPSETLF